MSEDDSSRDGGDDGGTETDGDADGHYPAAYDRESEWPVRDSVTEYETGWYTGGYDRVEQPDGTEKEYYWAQLPPAVVVIALDDDLPDRVSGGGGDAAAEDGDGSAGDAADGDRVVFVEQYRPVIRQTQLELPAGIVEDGETYEAAAARELEEETGLVAGETTLLDTVWCSTGVLRHHRGYVLAEDLSSGQRALDTNEFLAIESRPAGDALAEVRGGSTNDATLEGLLLARADGHLPR